MFSFDFLYLCNLFGSFCKQSMLEDISNVQHVDLTYHHHASLTIYVYGESFKWNIPWWDVDHVSIYGPNIHFKVNIDINKGYYYYFQVHLVCNMNRLHAR